MQMTLSDDELKAMMQRGWRGGLREGTPCGNGSTRQYTRNVVRWLPSVCADHGIQSVVDAGAGDLHWIKDVVWKVQYTPVDLVPRHPSVMQLDITKQPVPQCDAVLCRFVLNHLDVERVQVALALFKQSARYLIATHFVGDNINRNREFTRLDLTQWIGEPREMVHDGHEDNCRLALWKL